MALAKIRDAKLRNLKVNPAILQTRGSRTKNSLPVHPWSVTYWFNFSIR
jgi:hypothetical protein